MKPSCQLEPLRRAAAWIGRASVTNVAGVRFRPSALSNNVSHAARTKKQNKKNQHTRRQSIIQHYTARVVLVFFPLFSFQIIAVMNLRREAVNKAQCKHTLVRLAYKSSCKSSVITQQLQRSVCLSLSFTLSLVQLHTYGFPQWTIQWHYISQHESIHAPPTNTITAVRQPRGYVAYPRVLFRQVTKHFHSRRKKMMRVSQRKTKRKRDREKKERKHYNKRQWVVFKSTAWKNSNRIADIYLLQLKLSTSFHRPLLPNYREVSLNQTGHWGGD